MPPQHRRRPIRLYGYDYTTDGAYFVTICVQHRLPLLGVIRDAVVHPSAAGDMVESCWTQLPAQYPTVRLSTFVVMPNHLHGIILLDTDGEHAIGLGAVVGAFKSRTTVAYIQGVKAGRYPPFRKRLWQRDYYDRVIRNEREFEAVSAYIVNNPANWHQDDLYSGG
jgi:putative transposase